MKNDKNRSPNLKLPKDPKKNFISRNEFWDSLYFGVGKFPPLTNHKILRIFGKSDDSHYDILYKNWTGEKRLKTWWKILVDKDDFTKRKIILIDQDTKPFRKRKK
jgi:hypothetical protein